MNFPGLLAKAMHSLFSTPFLPIPSRTAFRFRRLATLALRPAHGPSLSLPLPLELSSHSLGLLVVRSSSISEAFS